MIRITVYAGAGPHDERDGAYEPSCTTRIVSERDVSEELRKLGLEWRQADYFPDRQTVITLDPVPASDHKVRSAREAIRNAIDALEQADLP